MRGIFVLATTGLLLAGALSARAAPLPLSDDRYVADTGLRASDGETKTINGHHVSVLAMSFRLDGKTFSLDAAGSAASSNSFATNASDSWYSSEYQNCDGSTIDIIDCVNDLHDKWDGRLNTAYRQIMNSETKEQKAALRDAQRKWITYRDANCAYYAGGEGSISRIEAAVCKYALTRDRARELEMIGE